VDAIITSILGATPQLGVGGVLLALLVILQRQQAREREDHRLELAAVSERHTTELKRVNTDHDTELAELRSDIGELRKHLDQLNAALDAERALRRQAEDMINRPGGDTPWSR
jgi:uncharacterized membrane protein